MNFFRRGKTIEGGEDFIKEKLNTLAYIWVLVSIFISFLTSFFVIPQLFDFIIGDKEAISSYLEISDMSYSNALYSRISIIGLNLLNILGYVLLTRLKKSGYYLILGVGLLSLYTEAFYFDGFQIADLKIMTGFLVTTALLMLSGENNSWKKLS